MRVDFFRQIGNLRVQGRGQASGFGGEGEGVKAGGFDVHRPVFQRAAGYQSPVDMQLAGEHAQGKGVVQGDGNELVVGQDVGLQELEQAVLGGFHGGDVAGQASELFT